MSDTMKALEILLAFGAFYTWSADGMSIWTPTARAFPRHPITQISDFRVPSHSTIRFKVSKAVPIGIKKCRPVAPRTPAVAIPITLPVLSSSGPPLFPVVLLEDSERAYNTARHGLLEGEIDWRPDGHDLLAYSWLTSLQRQGCGFAQLRLHKGDISCLVVPHDPAR